MASTRIRFEGAQKHLKLLEESWKTDHVEAMRCRDFEEYLAEAVMVFQLLNSVSQQRREYVYRGLEEASLEIDAMEKDLFGRWLATVESELKILESLEQSFGTVEGADKLRDSLDQAKSFLQTWTPAVQAMAPGSRVVEFSEEDADQIRAIMNSPPGSPGRNTRPPRSVPEGDPRLLK